MVMEFDSKKFAERIMELGLPQGIITPYYEEHRHYHNFDHIIDLVNQLEQRGLYDNDILFLSIIFHDIVYDSTRDDNEEKSVEVFMNEYSKYTSDLTLLDSVSQIIMDTKTHEPTSDLSKIFCDMDLKILDATFIKLIEWEHKIFKEYQFVDYKTYVKARIVILQQLYLKHYNPNILRLIEYVSSRKIKIGLYAGSFNPFHLGHLNILEKAEKIFDKVIIAQGHNPSKPLPEHPLPEVLKYREKKTYNGLLTDFIEELEDLDITLIRGLRNSTDLQQELTQYRFLQDLKPDIKSVSIFCDSQFQHISSSAIRELSKYDKQYKYII